MLFFNMIHKIAEIITVNMFNLAAALAFKITMARALARLQELKTRRSITAESFSELPSFR
jgi:hypothetical protein